MFKNKNKGSSYMGRKILTFYRLIEYNAEKLMSI